MRDHDAETNRLERLRDPSHGRTLSVAEISNLVAATGATIVHPWVIVIARVGNP